VTGIQKLAGLQDHFDDVLVAVILGTLSRFQVKEEDIHFEMR
jgi:hypothetical protein